MYLLVFQIFILKILLLSSRMLDVLETKKAYNLNSLIPMTKQITLTEGVEVPFDFGKHFVIYKYYFMCKGIITSILMKADSRVQS